MKKCVIDGSRLADAAAIYRVLGDAFRLAPPIESNPDALGNALGRYNGEPVAVVWRNAAQSAQVLGPQFADLVDVLERAAAAGVLTLELG
ncbi:MAG TPA: barstar family protein [Stellaceae bacterium]|nr:barstar family protein [Stellaceae bacterium]